MLAEGSIARNRLLGEMPRFEGTPVISMVPFSQLRERGFETHDDGELILSLVSDTVTDVTGDQGDDEEVDFSISELNFETSDKQFEQIVHNVVNDEIRRGEGSNFLISRTGSARITNFSPKVARAIFNRLARNEFGAYLTFCFFDGQTYYIGASPERHLTLIDRVATMNPICGTLPKQPSIDTDRLLGFLNDPKEVNELFQVVDEELKMMSRLCPEGGSIHGPFLKEMGSLIHTEYELSGMCFMDPIDAFRDSMFAATMIGSPLENAARVIKRYEGRSRGYYASAIIVDTTDDRGHALFDSAITIRTMAVTQDGRARLQSGASIVRDSDPRAEALEVKAKVAGLLRAISTSERKQAILPVLETDEVQSTLQSRNQYLSTFWMQRQTGATTAVKSREAKMLIVDNEDEFTYMLRHVFRRFDVDVAIKSYKEEAFDLGDYDLVLVGPGPGDPNDSASPKIRRVRSIVDDLLGSKQRFMAVCLGHQVLCQQLGMSVQSVDPPLQGVQVPATLFGQPERLGFYNTFMAREKALRNPEVEVATDFDGGVLALRSRQFVSFQFHVESVLTQRCDTIVASALSHLLENERYVRMVTQDGPARANMVLE